MRKTRVYNAAKVKPTGVRNLGSEVWCGDKNVTAASSECPECVACEKELTHVLANVAFCLTAVVGELLAASRASTPIVVM